nr:macro domain-containing protein [Clostridia bacterium]
MPFTIVCGDITQMHTDAIVNAANTELQKGGGVCGAIFNAAGTDKLQAACAPLAPIRTGEAVLTPGFNLSAKCVIHTAGPVYVDGRQGEREQLRLCYQNALKRAAEQGCRSIAFPLISSGIYGYPKAEALRVASEEIRRFLSQENCDMDVVLVLYDKSSFAVGGNLLGEVRRYARWCCAEEELQSDGTCLVKTRCAPFDQSDESPTEAVLRIIRKSGKTDAEVCLR